MDFSPVPVTFSLKDIGSEIIDQLSTDVYTEPGSILRELVKNAYDAYLALDPEDFEDESCQRTIVISRERDAKGVGRIILADHGIGQALDDLKANIQISISKKQDELENATGFRGLGSWATLGAGSKITISSSRKGNPHEFRLVIDVKRVYKLLSSTTTLDDILNESKCITFAQRGGPREEHYTIVEIECDGPPASIKGHEYNRLYDLTDPENDSLRELLIRHCPLPYTSVGDTHQKVHNLYHRVGYTPTPIILDGVTLERCLPASLTDFHEEELYLGDQVIAVAWAVEDPERTGEIGAIDEDEHFLGGPSVQLMRHNVPIGPKGLFADNVRSTIPNWYVGEVHILAADVLPNAGGQDLRAGTAKEAFIDVLRCYYKRLERRAESKSERVSLVKAMQQGIEAAKIIKSADLSEGRKQLEMAKIARAVETVEKITKKGKPATAADQRTREAAADPRVIAKRNEVRRALKDDGYLATLSFKPKNETAAKKKASPKNGDGPLKVAPTKSASLLNADEFQAKVGRTIPRLQELGLSQQQIDEVLKIIAELFSA